MSGNRGCVFNSLLFLICVFVPVVGHIIETFMILEDGHSPSGTVLWLVIVWALPFLGPFLYLLLGQRGQQRVMFGQPSYQYQSR
ncbi:MAG: PLDc N-terminal domain-containing protein [Ktedonobacteraceae bacterium]|nr:PLDc N-terminal domain-containing protein [Ktedonobacteraceae bacterium]MDQ2903221.1 PLDc N-terminal domain-containing protein [Chloroflexota bacterium]